MRIASDQHREAWIAEVVVHEQAPNHELEWAWRWRAMCLRYFKVWRSGGYRVQVEPSCFAGPAPPALDPLVVIAHSVFPW